MSIFEPVVLGIVQGAGEFLPISSSAHLIIIPYLFGWQAHSLSFDVMLHMGTLFAVGGYFWRDWLVLIKGGLLNFQKPSPEGRLFWLIAAATIPAALIGWFLEDKAETVFRHPLLVGLALVVFGLILYLAQRLSRNKKTLAELSLKDAFLIGVGQCLAIVPGVSRSGSTIAFGLFLNFNKEAAVRFSFLLSFPIILGAGVLKIKDIFSIFTGGQAGFLWLGFITSGLFGLFSIHFLLKFIEKRSFNIFIYYRLVLAAITIGVFVLRRGL